MGKREAGSCISASSTFTDVVYLSDKTDIPAEVRRLFRQKKLSYRLLPFDGYKVVHRRPNLVGTVVIDAEDMDTSRDLEFGRILESLERDNIGIIVLTHRVERPVKSFSLVSSDSSFSMANSVESVSLDDLWARISVNLAYRKGRRSGIAVKPPVSVSAAERSRASKVAGQLEASGTFVDNVTEQLRLAGLVQRDFLPSYLPNCDEVQWAATFIPAEWVSGDIYDVARIDEQHIGFYVADAVGHSMPAALLTIFIKQALMMRETIGNSYRIFPPAEVMGNLNTRMAEQKLSGYQFATCCYGLLNIKTLQLTFARAGHPYPILFRKGQDPRQLQTRGALLGVFENAEFVPHTIQLQPGDRLLIYSDGAESLIGQLSNETDFQFSDEVMALKDAPLTEMIDALTELAANREVPPAEIDDITLVALQTP